eukprot:CAMPEP_0197542394 /NCGR_PEP_ID=MMETSP1318-20131121/67680_1 /TAXON_ID=552666 /ORGANISM="Partenskyella glossopodia, Strain RCC365" /LENGTH=630 /DNA_ID=CAMNT_0043101653 /DNA_START=152 /DNA_END=2045 /DNA_ORIENTATION=+
MPKLGLKSKSPAEFFAENQNIAGFDNAGKSLYTTVREFVENSLDAAESIGALPSVVLSIEQLSDDTFSELRGYSSRKRKDLSLYQSSHQKKPNSKRVKQNGVLAKHAAMLPKTEFDKKSEDTTTSSKKKTKSSRKKVAVFRVTCEDNGVGMPHEKIPSMLGLGAKMALVWAKKSTGLPIEVESAREGQRISRCRLDIDIQENKPRVLLHERIPNPDGWRGTKISVVIEGNFLHYRSKVISYLRQLAVITPYADFKFSFQDESNHSRDVEMHFARRSDNMPNPPEEVKHHPSSVNNLVVESLIAGARKNLVLPKFLCKFLSCITAKHAKRLVDELGIDDDMPVGELSKKQIHQLTSLLREAKFTKPSGRCLSPAGEYNLRLGIIKELNPEIVATFCDKPNVHEGHPFIVEAAVCLGGSIAKPGINIYRYANRIPLLFEVGSDISSIIATKKIRWNSYKIKNTDKVGVFVSIVSTKIPFKGTSKEYIGDDKGPLHDSVKKAIMNCCVQLKKELVKKNALRDQQERKKQLSKYIPDVGRALIGTLKSIMDEGGQAAFGPDARFPDFVRAAVKKRGDVILENYENGTLDSKALCAKLRSYVQQIDKQLALEFATEKGKNLKNLDDLYITLQKRE